MSNVPFLSFAINEAQLWLDALPDKNTILKHNPLTY